MFLKALIAVFSIQFVSVALPSVQKDKNAIFLFIQLIVYCYELWCKYEKWTLSNCNSGLGWQEFSLFELMSHRLKCHYKCAFLHVVKSRVCILWKQLKIPPKILQTQGFHYSQQSCSEATLLLGASHAEDCFAGSRGNKELCCLPAFGTYCMLDLAYFKLGADSKGVFLSTDLVRILN